MSIEPPVWTLDGSNILSKDNLEKIQKVFETSGPILVQHWYYFGSHSPEWYVFNDLEDFQDYISKQSQEGDAFDVWDIFATCDRKLIIAEGKKPNSEGLVPKGGAY
jgi:hypothetical protein